MQGFTDKVTFKLSLKRVVTKWQPSRYNQHSDECIMECIRKVSSATAYLMLTHIVIAEINNAKYLPQCLGQNR